jgi:hypothetical protein
MREARPQSSHSFGLTKWCLTETVTGAFILKNPARSTKVNRRFLRGQVHPQEGFAG